MSIAWDLSLEFAVGLCGLIKVRSVVGAGTKVCGGPEVSSGVSRVTVLGTWARLWSGPWVVGGGKPGPRRWEHYALIRISKCGCCWDMICGYEGKLGDRLLLLILAISIFISNS